MEHYGVIADFVDIDILGIANSIEKELWNPYIAGQVLEVSEEKAGRNQDE